MSLQGLAVLAAGLVAGGQICVLLVVVRAARRATPLDSLHLHQSMISTEYPDAYIQPAGIVAFALGGVLLGLEERTSANVVLTAVPMAAIVGIVILTRTINRPINRQLESWTDQDVDQYPPLRRRWDHAHALRAICGTIAFVSYIILANH